MKLLSSLPELIPGFKGEKAAEELKSDDSVPFLAFSNALVSLAFFGNPLSAAPSFVVCDSVVFTPSERLE
jgi:hypothetical protein